MPDLDMPNIRLSVFGKSHAATHSPSQVRSRCARSCDSPNGWERHLSGRGKAGETEQSSFRLSNSGRWDRRFLPKGPRVSTGRQAAGDVSLPSQRDITTAHCMLNNWIVTQHSRMAVNIRSTSNSCCAAGCVWKMSKPVRPSGGIAQGRLVLADEGDQCSRIGRCAAVRDGAGTVVNFPRGISHRGGLWQSRRLDDGAEPRVAASEGAPLNARPSKASAATTAISRIDIRSGNTSIATVTAASMIRPVLLTVPSMSDARQSRGAAPRTNIPFGSRFGLAHCATSLPCSSGVNFRFCSSVRGPTPTYCTEPVGS